MMNVTYIFDEYFIYNDEIFASLLGVRHQFTYLLTYLLASLLGRNEIFASLLGWS